MHLDNEDEKDPKSSGYEQVADKIGLVPNVRGRDNLIQGAVCFVFAAAAGVIGGVGGGGLMGAAQGVVVGLLAGGFLTGVTLMVLGLFRR